jgi:hypothetical protein
MACVSKTELTVSADVLCFARYRLRAAPLYDQTMRFPRADALLLFVATVSFWAFALGSCGRYATAPDVSQDAGFDQALQMDSATVLDADAGTSMDADASRGCQLTDLLKGAGSMNSLGPWSAYPPTMLSASSDGGLNGSPAALFCTSGDSGVLNGYFTLQKERGVLNPAGKYRFIVSHKNVGVDPGPAIALGFVRQPATGPGGEQVASENAIPTSTFDCKQVTATVVVDGGADQYLFPQINPSFRKNSQCFVLDEARMYSVPLGSQFPPECDCPTL